MQVSESSWRIISVAIISPAQHALVLFYATNTWYIMSWLQPGALSDTEILLSSKYSILISWIREKTCTCVLSYLCVWITHNCAFREDTGMSAIPLANKSLLQCHLRILPHVGNIQARKIIPFLVLSDLVFFISKTVSKETWNGISMLRQCFQEKARSHKGWVCNIFSKGQWPAHTFVADAVMWMK